MATATAMAMLKMDENVNLGLERHVNRALFIVYGFPPGTDFLYFSKYWVARDGNAKGVKVRNFKLVTVTQFTKLE